VLVLGKDCPDCRMAEAVMDDVAFVRTGRLKVLTIDADRAVLAGPIPIVSTPTCIMLRNGMQIARLDGVPDEGRADHGFELHLNT